ncbi:MAG: hypothetical protein MUD01_10125 [Chloroflexaceae bacterium]|jgi:hypothetical protein|nr:hypothetical protein [Chloroflexaceae bacterium]
MCNFFTPLAHHDSSHFIAQCEHGTIHIVWMRTTVHLHPTNFAELAQLLERAEQLPSVEHLRHSCFCMLRDMTGAAQVWMAEVGLALRPDDVPLFTSLVQQAEATLESGLTTTASRNLLRDSRAYCEQDSLTVYGLAQN